MSCAPCRQTCARRSDAARLDLGVRYAVGSQKSLYANANVELSDRGQSLSGTVGLRITW